MDAQSALAALGSTRDGLSGEEAARRLALAGSNALARPQWLALTIFLRQLNNPLLLLLGATALASAWFHQHTDAIIILAILALSVGLGYFNEYRSARAIEDLHSRIRRTTQVVRNGHLDEIDVAHLVPGDIVRLSVGDIVPADLRLIDVHAMECDEAVLTGEPQAVEKTERPEPAGGPNATAACCAYMGTVVRSGSALAVVYATGVRTVFGRIARRLNTRVPVTTFARGLHDFSNLLVHVTAVLTISLFAINTLLHHPLLESLLFALAIAVGLTPQLLPAIVTISLSFGATRMARRSVIVKRLVAIEDFGNIEVLFTDKTGTLTEGHVVFAQAYDPLGAADAEVLRLGALCTAQTGGSEVGASAVDSALAEAVAARGLRADTSRRLDEVPFDYERRRMSVLIDDDGRRLLVVKGAPEFVLARCAQEPQARTQAFLHERFSAGDRVIAVAARELPGATNVAASDEQGLSLVGFLTFLDPPKATAGQSLERLAVLGVEVKIATGDNERVARHVCADVGIEVLGALDGSDIERMSDDELRRALPKTNIFARLSPEQKSHLVRLQRSMGTDVGFLGDGVNDAVALHDADVGISVDSAADVAKDAADIVLLEKDLGVLADGIVEGRRIFANTIKYVLMGTSSNFGNMFSAAGASLVLPFLPMLPSQILLNNLLYDVGEMTIPGDNVDPESLLRPAHWDMSFIRSFMLWFGPISSIFDFLTFWVMIALFHAGESLFRSGWFVESLMTQSLVIFAIRTRRVPFFHSRPGAALTITTLVCVAVGALLPFTPVAGFFGFTPLPPGYFLFLLAAVAAYIALVECAKASFYRRAARAVRLRPAVMRRFAQVAARFLRP